MYIDNASVAIMSRLNELAARHGIIPVEFYASLESDLNGQRTLRFIMPPDNPALEQPFLRMLGDLGIVDDDVSTIRGSDAQLYAVIEAALARAPRARSGR